jgi:hypothetical protein
MRIHFGNVRTRSALRALLGTLGADGSCKSGEISFADGGVQGDLSVTYGSIVVITDIGTEVSPGVLWGGNTGTCDTYEGDDGVMQTAPCITRSGTTPGAQSACAALQAFPNPYGRA